MRGVLSFEWGREEVVFCACCEVVVVLGLVVWVVVVVSPRLVPNLFSVVVCVGASSKSAS